MKPKAGDYNSYYQTYIDKLPDENIFSILENQQDALGDFLNSIDEKKSNFRYAEGKWNIKQVIGHVIDGERVFTFRIHAISRNEKQSLPGFEQDDYIEAGNYSERSFEDIKNEFLLMRKANLVFYKSLTDEMISKKGNANGSDITVNALLYIIAGHAEHHLQVIRENYLNENL